MAGDYYTRSKERYTASILFLFFMVGAIATATTLVISPSMTTEAQTKWGNEAMFFDCVVCKKSAFEKRKDLRTVRAVGGGYLTVCKECAKLIPEEND